MIFRALAAASIVTAASASAFAGPRIESHSIQCRLDPTTGRIEAIDRMTVLREDGGPLVVNLNSGLTIVGIHVDRNRGPVTPERLSDDGWITKWRVPVPNGAADKASVEFTYTGVIADQVKKSEDLSFVVGDDTRGVICAEGVYLSEGSGWYPSDESMARFDIQPSIAEPYLVVTQGTRSPETGAWTGKFATDGVSLVAGKWKREERKTAGGVLIGTYLSEADAPHAKLLLDATEGYLRKYSELLGPYAYDRFDIVENWFTTGFGMPEFTLLGRDVIAGRIVPESQRTGSIPSGYLDHEIVHCWWGNLVFPDYASGNWCEGLTSYCANYMSQEWTDPDKAREHRRRAVLRFTLGATPERDYPVRQFRTKTEAVDDDIGYGKCSMLFHALRREVGDEAFWATLRRVSKTARGKRFSWDDWRREFETTSQRNLAQFFAQGLDRRGAPLFSVKDTVVSADAGRLTVSGTLVQTLREGEAPWRCTVPVVVEHLEGREETFVDCAAAETRFSALSPSLPLRITVDPDFHVFRRLADDEVPPCLAAMLGRPEKVVVYPDGDEPMKAAAEAAAARAGGVAFAASEAPAELARGTSYLVFGDAARVPLLASLRTKLPRHFPSSRATETTCVLATSRSPVDPAEFVTTLVGPAAAAGKRARAVFYYQYDGRIVFDGNIPKERGQSPTLNHASRTLLPDLKGATEVASVRALVDRLAAPEMNGRLAGGPEERRARAAIVEQFTLAGLDVDERPFEFSVKAAPSAELFCGGPAVAGVVPLVASPAVDAAAFAGFAAGPDADLKGRALLLDLPSSQENVLKTLRDAADLAKANGATALVVRLPEQPSKAVLELSKYPADGTPAHAAAGTAARTGGIVELALPTVTAPHDFAPPVSATPTGALRVAFRTDVVKSANIVARVKAGGHRRPGVVVLGAHFDHLGTGFPGADDDASGVAALTEAARILSANAEILGRDVVLVAFGAEEWGLRGSAAFVASWPKDQPIVAMINADTVGRRGVADVNVVGVSKHPRLARTVAAALEQANLDVGRDIDAFAFAYGSDHWSFHEAGVPAVDLWSGDYQVMHTAGDTADQVDEAKVSRIGRALALAAMAVAGGF